MGKETQRGRLEIRQRDDLYDGMYVVGYAVGDHHFKLLRLGSDGKIQSKGVPLRFKTVEEAQELVDYMIRSIPGLE